MILVRLNSALGYTNEQAAEIMKMGQMGQGCSNKSQDTFTQLIGTVKEAIGSGLVKSPSRSFSVILKRQEHYSRGLSRSGWRYCH